MILYKETAKIFLVIGILTLLSWTFNSSVFSKQESEEQINQWIEQLNAEDWRTRSIAVSHLDHLKENQKTEKVKNSLINLLRKEIIIEKDGKEYIRTAIKSQGEGEGFMEYIGLLLDAVANLRDVRTIPIFVEYTSWGRRMLPEIGEPAVEPLIEKLNNSMNAVTAFTLGEMVKPKDKGYVAKGKTREKIKQSLIKALEKSKHPTDKKIEWYEHRAMKFAVIRRAVVHALGNFGDADVIPRIKKIAKEDPYFQDFTKKKNYKGPKKRYMVREEAERVLKQLEANKKEEGTKKIEQKEEKENK